MKPSHLLVCLLFLTTPAVFGQAPLKELKAGRVLYISVPDYMSRTSGLNTSASVQYKSVVKDVAGFVIQDIKEDLALADIHYASIREFYDDFIGDFIKDEEKRTVSEVKYTSKGDAQFAESDASYYDKDSQIEIYYLVGIVETPNAFYKVITWSALENKATF